jgi:hypothetical protein
LHFSWLELCLNQKCAFQLAGTISESEMRI